MTKIVNIKTSKPHVGNIQHDYGTSFKNAVRALVNSEVRNYMAAGGRLGHLALKADKTTTTVSKLAYYETTNPRWDTVIDVLTALEVMEKFGELAIKYAKK